MDAALLELISLRTSSLLKKYPQQSSQAGDYPATATG